MAFPTDDIDPNEDVDPNEDIDNDADEHEGDTDDDRDDDRDPPKRSRSAARAFRRERSARLKLEAEVAELRKAIKSGGIGTEPKKDSVDVDTIRKQLMEEVKAEVSRDANARILVTEAKTALKEAGFTGRAERGVRLLDLDDLDPNSGTFAEDLLERIEELEEESPRLFSRNARPTRESRDTVRSRRHRDDEDEDERDSSSRRRTRSEGMSRERNGGGSNMDSLERALRQMVGAPRNRE